MDKSFGKTIRAYTLIEVLLTTALLVGLIGLSVPVYQNFQLSNEVDETTNIIVRTLRSAQVQSQSVQQDSTWGVFYASGSITIYKGASFATRDSTQDQSYVVPTSVTISGVNDIVFAKLTGIAATTGNISLANFNNTRTISVNAKGRLSY